VTDEIVIQIIRIHGNFDVWKASLHFIVETPKVVLTENSRLGCVGERLQESRSGYLLMLPSTARSLGLGNDLLVSLVLKMGSNMIKKSF